MSDELRAANERLASELAKLQASHEQLRKNFEGSEARLADLQDAKTELEAVKLRNETASKHAHASLNTEIERLREKDVSLRREHKRELEAQQKLVAERCAERDAAIIERDTQAAAFEWEIATLKVQRVQLETDLNELRAAFLADDEIAETLQYETLDYELTAALEESASAAGDEQPARLTRTLSGRFSPAGGDQGPAKFARSDSGAGEGGGF